MYDARYERELECTECHEVIVVGGFFDDIDPYTYRGYVCGCRREKPRQPDVRALELADTIERAREAQKAGR